MRFQPDGDSVPQQERPRAPAAADLAARPATLMRSLGATSPVALALMPLLAHSRGDLQVLGRLGDALGLVADAARSQDRRRALLGVLRELRAEVADARPKAIGSVVLARLSALENRLPVMDGRIGVEHET